MTLITRITRLWKADMHTLLDTIEEPQAVLRQSLREMEETISAGEGRRERMKQRDGELAALTARRKEELAECESRISLCFEAEDEPLARTFVRRKLELSKQLRELGSAAEQLHKERVELEQRIAQRKAQLERIRQDAALAAGRSGASADSCTAAVSEEEVAIALLEERRRWNETQRVMEVGNERK